MDELQSLKQQKATMELELKVVKYRISLLEQASNMELELKVVKYRTSLLEQASNKPQGDIDKESSNPPRKSGDDERERKGKRIQEETEEDIQRKKRQVGS